MQQVLWIQLHRLFESDDGSLPGIYIESLAGSQVVELYGKAMAQAGILNEPTLLSKGAFSDAPARLLPPPANLVVEGKAEPFRYGLTNLKIGTITLPDLTIHVKSNAVSFDYRMGTQWGPLEVEALFAFLWNLVRDIPNAEVFHAEEGLYQNPTEVFSRAWQRYRWTQCQIDALKSLRAVTVIRWIGTEVALRESGTDGLPDWEDNFVPYLQLDCLDVELEGSKVARIVTYQDNDDFGICRRDDLGQFTLSEEIDPTSIFRRRELSELPVGCIDGVNVLTSHGVICRLELLLGRNRVTLIPGEVYEQEDCSLKIKSPDESILVQVNSQRPSLSLGEQWNRES